jgi:hypothetical protein
MAASGVRSTCSRSASVACVPCSFPTLYSGVHFSHRRHDRVARSAYTHLHTRYVHVLLKRPYMTRVTMCHQIPTCRVARIPMSSYPVHSRAMLTCEETPNFCFFSWLHEHVTYPKTTRRRRRRFPSTTNHLIPSLCSMYHLSVMLLSIEAGCSV